ncbi:MAG: hypothetical protein RL326_2128 [Pseudomonadota bacterium]|jgi:ElaB/YqjD/DUF883 family membrane-anchored ribosome-binding protein
MDAAHDVNGASPERLRQEIRQTTQALEQDVERLQGVVRDRAQRVKRAFFMPEFVNRNPARACAIAAGVGFLVSRLRSKRHVGHVSRRVAGGTGLALREIGIAVATRAIQGALSRR